ncbi:Short-chain dehydrogenase [Geosmithia morbida]|uniref:Short-chain dehydrogenase n=1 Tax=Geosmithia morbida TaxID=1094350 RepID=A0A9P5D261_9HYPO|nr:Short-chain dehydrogenase [Geosmithia morbida]KAF4124668.1 Short-chain dehydrogenase [Geosmithia morbida]
MGRLEGKIAIVTGAAAGFGEGIAQHFIEEGAKVFVCDINVELGEKVASTSDKLFFQKLNVTDKAGWDRAIDQVISKFGRLDILVNNAGTSYLNKAMTEAEFDKVMSVNVKSVFLGTQAFAVQAKKNGTGGAIINIASVGAHRPRPGLVWYNASKAAIANATMGLAAEYGPDGIRVNSICPLATMTSLLPTFIGKEITPEVQKALSNVPLQRMGEIRDVTKAAVFLASEDASFITGVNLDVDGGRAI